MERSGLKRIKAISRIISMFMVVVMISIAAIPAKSVSADSSVDAAKKISKESVTLAVGQTTQLKVNGVKASSVKWSTSNKKIATVDNKGKVKAVKKGNAVITAKVGKTKYTCKVKVVNVGLESKKLTVEVGAKTKLNVYGTKIKKVKSSNTKILTVTKSGVINPKKVGKANVSVTCKNGKTYTCKVTVKKAMRTVTFDSQGGTKVNPVKVEKGKKVKEPTSPTKDCYTFAGWYTDSFGNNKFDFANTPIVDDITLYASWDDIVNVNVDKQELKVNDYDREVIITAQYSLGDVTSMKLYNADTDEFISDMVDDGAYQVSGDDLPGDSKFSVKEYIDTYEEKDYHYYVLVNDSIKSATVTVKVIAGFTDEQIQNIEAVQDKLKEKVFDDASYESQTVTQRKKAADAALKELASGGLIDGDSLSYDKGNATYGFLYKDGAVGIMSIAKRFDNVNGSVAEEVDIVDDQDSVSIAEEATEVIAEEAVEVVSEEATEDSVIRAEREVVGDIEAIPEGGFVVDEDMLSDDGTATSISVLDLWSFGQDWDQYSYRVPFYNNLVNEWKNKGVSLTVDFDTTVNDYRNINGFDAVITSGHGAYYSYKVGDQYITSSGLILTQEADEYSTEQYSLDLKGKRVGIISVQGGDKFAILPSFFPYYYDNELDGTFVYMENCETFGKYYEDTGVDVYSSIMAESICEGGAESVIGFHNSVMADYSREGMKTYMESLFDGKTSEEAFNDFKKKHGANDYFTGREMYGPTAVPHFVGDPTARMVNMYLKNGDFEESNIDLPGWRSAGDVRNISKLGSINPYSNKQMAILTTGIGSLEQSYISATEGSVLSQTVIVPSNATTLSFAYDVVSEEPMEYVNSMYDDTFIAQIVSEGTAVEMARVSINTAEWNYIEGIDFDGGDHTTYHTMWKECTYDVSKYAGQKLTIQFIVYDVGDSIYDTAALIDKVQFN